jgi:regulator of sigma E protease
MLAHLHAALGTVLPFLFVLTLVVSVHELGHYWAGRWCGVKIDAFSIGFGPRLFGWTDKHGTDWKVCAIPLGGYVKFAGDLNAASVPDQDHLGALRAQLLADGGEKAVQGCYHFKPVWQRMIIAVAGPMANFILAIAIFTLAFVVMGREVSPARVDGVAPHSAAERAGFMTGDLILKAEGRAIESFSDLQEIVAIRAGEPIAFVVDRKGKQVMLTAIPERREMKDRFGGMHRIGVLGLSRGFNATEMQYEKAPLAQALPMATVRTWRIATDTLGYLKRVILGIEPADQIGGPLRIAQVSGQVAEAGFGADGSLIHKLGTASMALIGLAAVLSVSIGLLNLFPVPMLDGGHLLFYAYEAVVGKPLHEKIQSAAFNVGMVMVLGLMVFATWNDVQHLRIVDTVLGWAKH